MAISQDVGSLDKIIKRVGRIEEDVTRLICHNVGVVSRIE